MRVINLHHFCYVGAAEIIRWVEIFGVFLREEKNVSKQLKNGLNKASNFQKEKTKRIACVPFGRTGHLISYEN